MFGVLNTMVLHLLLYVRYWWNEVHFSSAVITFDRLYFNYVAIVGDLIENVICFLADPMLVNSRINNVLAVQSNLCRINRILNTV